MADAKERSEFDKWFIADSQWYDATEGLGLAEYNLAREAWDRAIILAAGKVVTDGNPDVAREKILGLLSAASPQ